MIESDAPASRAWPAVRTRRSSLAGDLVQVARPPIKHTAAGRAASMALAVMDGGINGPKVQDGHPDRVIGCEADLAPVFNAMAQVAAEVGWRPHEVAAALVNLADNHVLRIIAADEDAQRVAEAIEEAGRSEP